jgi:regulator of replication initiation timing
MMLKLIDEILLALPDNGGLKASFGKLKAEIEKLEKENTLLKSENHVLKSQIQELNSKLQKDEENESSFDETTNKILQIFFDKGKTTSDFIGQALRIKKSTVEYHFNLLLNAKMIRQSSVAFGQGSASYDITHDGRAYVVKISEG